MLHAGEGSAKGTICGSIVGAQERRRYCAAVGPLPLHQQFSVVSADESDTALIATDGPVLKRGIWVGPFLIDKFIAVDEPRDLLKRQAFSAQIGRDQRIAMARSLDRPLLPRATNTAPTIEVGEPLDEPYPAFDIGEMIDDKLQLKGIDTNIRADASNLCDPPEVAQKEVLFAIKGLQQGLPASDFAKRNDTAEPVFIAISNVGGDNAPVLLRPPENLGFKAVMIGIGERYRGPRPRRARSAAAPGARPYRRSNGSVGAVRALRDASRSYSRDCAEDTPRRPGSVSKDGHDRSRSATTRWALRGVHAPPSPSPIWQSGGHRRHQRRRLSQAPLLSCIVVNRRFDRRAIDLDRGRSHGPLL